MHSYLKKFTNWQTLLVLLFLIIAYGQTLFMYFWQDDSALIFKLQHPAEQAGSFGVGIWQRGAYQYLVPPFVPFFPLFGLEPFGYYLVGFITYALATLAFYFFVKEILETKFGVGIATLLFAAGYVGSDTMFRIINSWQTNIGLVLSLITLTFLVRYLKAREKKYYFLTLLVYFFTIELVFIRSHSLIFPIIFVDAIYSLLPFKFKSFLHFIIRQLPFIILFRIWYLSDANFGSSGLSSLVGKLLHGEFETMAPLIANIGNGIVSDQLQNIVIQFTNNLDFDERYIIYLLTAIAVISCGSIYLLISRTSKIFTFENILLSIILIIECLVGIHFYSLDLLYFNNLNSLFSFFLGLNISTVIIYWGIKNFNTNKILSIAALAGLAVISSQIFGYYTQYPSAIFSTTHRYFSYSAIGFALLWGSLLTALFNKKQVISIAVFVFIAGSHLLLGFSYQSRILAERSIPSRDFYKALLDAAPEVQKGSLFYFDVVADPFYQRQFGDFFSVGSMPETTALAIYYNLDRYDVGMITNFDELAYKLSSGQNSIDQLYSFFYGPRGLVDTTAEMRMLLAESTSLIRSSSEDIPNKPLTPLLVRAQLETQLVIPEKFEKDESQLTTDEKLNMLNYLVSREKYYNKVHATSSSDWKFREIRQIIDNDSTTTWQGHRIYWGENNKEELNIDLREVRNISAIKWQNWQAALSPTSYTIEVSLDQKSWKEIVTVRDANPRKNNEEVVERFNPINARFIRMVITQTATNDSPAIVEFEAVEDKFIQVDSNLAIEFAKDPFKGAQSRSEWQAILAAIRPIAKLQFVWQRDNKDMYNNQIDVDFDITKNNQIVEFIIPAGGTHVENINVHSSYPLLHKIDNIEVKNISLEEMEKMNLIKVFKEN